MTNDLKSQIITAVEACRSKKAEDLVILEMDKQAFTDYLILCHGTNPRQVQAIADEVELRLKSDHHSYPNCTEGYQQAEWVLLDYVDFVVHAFTAEQRRFRDLERLWKSARRVSVADIKTRAMRPRKAAPAGAGKRKGARPKVASSIKARKSIREAASRRPAAKKLPKKRARKAAPRKKKR